MISDEKLHKTLPTYLPTNYTQYIHDTLSVV